jgi:SRSO17 transposase
MEVCTGFDGRLDVFIDVVGQGLRSETQRAAFTRYAVGLLSPLERKSIEPIAARTRPDDADAEHQRLLYFVADAPWSDRVVRRASAAWALHAATTRGPVQTTIIDDTGMLKQGTHSVGVARQYTGSAGKITNCQVAVTLAVATDHDTVPLDVALYLPDAWANDPAQRAAGKVPDDVAFQTKPQLALAMLAAARRDHVPLGEVVLADADYGRCRAFRDGVTALGLAYAVGVQSTQRIWDATGLMTAPMTVAEVASWLQPRQFRRLTWRDGRDGRPLSARFAFLRVYAAHGDAEPTRADRTEWLIVEWRDGEDEPVHFYLSTLPRRRRKRAIVRTLKERYRTEKMNEELKGEVGFDHYEGRFWRGWHHHVSAALACYALLVAERIVAFPPCAVCGRTTGALARAA